MGINIDQTEDNGLTTENNIKNQLNVIQSYHFMFNLCSKTGVKSTYWLLRLYFH